MTKATLAQHLIASQENERQRIARELHDSLGQDLLLIRNFALLGAQENADAPKAVERFSQISHCASRAVHRVREISYALRPQELDRLGLSEAIRAMARQAAESSPIEIDVASDQIDGLLPAEFEIHLYRVVQECVTNILKHSRAGRAEIRIQRQIGCLIVSIRDDGVGIDQDRKGRQGAREGTGLAGMVERVRIMGGRMEFGAEMQPGTLVQLTIPSTVRRGHSGST